MFCLHCGEQLPDVARFCSGCGNPLNGPSPTQASPPPPPTYTQHASPPPVIAPQAYQQPAFSQVPPHQAQYPQPSRAYAHPAQTARSLSAPVFATIPTPVQNSPLLDPVGFPQPAFERLAASLFNGLDQTIAPQRTGMLEVPKMAAYRTLGGLTIPPYFGEHVLPAYCSIIGVELAPHRPQNAPVVTWNGWHHYLLHKIKLEPEATFTHVVRVGTALGLQLPLNRLDFPPMPDANAQAKEAQFKTHIYAKAQNAFGARAVGGVAGQGVRVGQGNGHGQGHARRDSNENTKLALGILTGVVKFANTEANNNGQLF